MKKTILLLTIICLLTACSDRQKVTELQSKVADLEKQLDDCQKGADKIFAKIKISYEKKDFNDVKKLFSEMTSKHLSSELYPKVKAIYDTVVAIEKAVQIAANQKIQAENEEKLKALNKLKKDFDDVQNITWYFNPYFKHYTNSNSISIYIGVNSTSKWLRLKMSYYGEDWIFFTSAYLSYQGNTLTIPFNEYRDKKTENSGGSVWEWIDVTVTKDIQTFLKSFAQSKDAKMRLSGKYTKTRNLSNNERQGIIDILNGFETINKAAEY